MLSLRLFLLLHRSIKRPGIALLYILTYSDITKDDGGPFCCDLKSTLVFLYSTKFTIGKTINEVLKIKMESYILIIFCDKTCI